ncbi:MAG: amidohydrolase [Selenomonadaceae bacterium]|nr:amidohydrolase [Selenomonadaceae bacterium]
MDESAIKAFIEETFTWLHSHPELSYEEHETTAQLKKILSKERIRLLELPLATGAAAEIGDGSKPVIALRADIDALPIEEDTGLPYASRFKGKMHACGHDFHTAAVLGAALLLKKKESSLPGRVRIVFQPAEEAPGGAQKVLETGVLDEAQAIFAIHTSPLLPVGSLGLSPGPVMAAVDSFILRFQGKGCHAAHPDRGVDIIPLIAHFISMAQTIVSRNSNPFAANLLSITRVEAGNTWNVLPETAELEGTARSLTLEDRLLIKDRLYALARGAADAFGASVAIDWHQGPPPTINDAFWTEFVLDTAGKQGFILQEAPKSLGGEDFSYYQEKIPGVFASIGTGLSAPNHSPEFRADPAALLPAAKFLAAIAEGALRKLAT